MAQLRFFLHDEADADLAEIEDYLTTEAGPRIAERNLARIIEKLQTLAAFPGLGRVRDDLRDAPHSFAVAPWVVFYDPLPEGGIAVWRIVHGRRNLKAFVKKPD